ncbi:NADH-ubiquinone oxidoreductase chain G [hydrothermal vent metagenome]|uniref:NADH-ubiquinone oxidoreductase chain G n=1 Tax=hydrothermal vent metagenome TaxID=652676 RepID=A0A3B0V0R6_9ZZZZ
MTDNTNTIPDHMVQIEIDDKSMLVPKGSMVIEAADNNGIAIPRFCYHKKLSISANCRMCMVDVEKVPKPLPACATPVAAGMKVYTKSKRAIDAQRNVMEFLLINHPLDCPICDQGGECELQDISMGYGRGISRYVDEKRVAIDEDIGSLIATDMTRCILCTRCVRFLDEITGTDELGGIGRGDRTQIGTAVGRSIDAVMSANVIDLCPVGALTNKPFKFKARAWELMAVAGVSMHDAIGSNLYYHTRAGQILRTVPKDNESLNEAWLSDRDRYGVLGQYSADRISRPMIKENGQWQDTDWATAMDFAVRKLQAHDASNTAVLAGSQTTNEEYFLLHKLFKALGCDNIDYRLSQTDFSQAHRLPRVDIELDNIIGQNQIILLGSNVSHEQPILAHRIRQAWLKNQTKISVFNPKAYNFNFNTLHNYIANQVDWVKGLGSLAHCVAELSKQKLSGDLGNWIATQATDENLNNLAKQILDKDNSTLFIIGQIANSHPQAGLIKALTAWLSSHTNGKVYEMATGANAVGAEICGMSAQNDVATILHSEAKSFVIYQAENDDFDNAFLAHTKLDENTDSVILISSFADQNMQQVADVILPIGLMSEVAGSCFNNFIQNQSFSPAAKLPGETKPGWRVLRVLGNMLNVDGFTYDSIDEITAEVNKLKIHSAPGNIECEINEINCDDLILFNETAIYDVDMLTRRSQPLQDTVHASTDNLNINSIDAKKLGLENAMQVILNQNFVNSSQAKSSQHVALFVNIDDDIPLGSVNVGKCVGLRSDALNVTLTVGDSI